MQSDQGCDKHHHVHEWQGWAEQSQRSENVYNVHVPDPAVVNVLVEHVRVHLVFFLIKLINRLEFVVVKLSLWSLFPRLSVFLELKIRIRPNSRNQGEYQIDYDQR